MEKEQRIDKKYEEIEQKRTELQKKEERIEEKTNELDKKYSEIEQKLENISKLSQEEAKNLLLQYTEERYEKDILGLMEKKKKELHAREAELSREILIKAIQQYA